MFNNIITFTMKYNLYIMKTSTWTQLAFCLLSSVFYACSSSHIYYLDATSGSDQNNGTSPRSAWQSIEALKQISLQPGDKILFKKGETFSGILEVTGKAVPHRYDLLNQSIRKRRYFLCENSETQKSSL